MIEIPDSLVQVSTVQLEQEPVDPQRLALVHAAITTDQTKWEKWHKPWDNILLSQCQKPLRHVRHQQDEDERCHSGMIKKERAVLQFLPKLVPSLLVECAQV